MARALLSCVLAAALLSAAGCPTGDGDGEVVGSFYLLGCDDAYNYGTPEQPARFVMGADFFVGEPIIDEGLAGQHRLDLRIQQGGNNVEDSDNLYLQIADVGAVAAQFVASQPTPAGVGTALRATLSLYVTCPTFFGQLEAVTPSGLAACPSLDASALEGLCGQVDYQAELDPDVPLAPFEAHHSCVIFCSFGPLQRGQAVPEGFAVEFGHTVRAIFHLNLTEQRLLATGQEICDDGWDNDGDGTIDGSDCQPSAGFGQLQGAFNFEVRRGQVAQEFP